MIRAAALLAAVLAATLPAANAATAIFVEKARLADPAPAPNGGDERAQYDHQTFEQSVALHTIVPGDGVVIAIRNSVESGPNGDSSYYEKFSIELPASSPGPDVDLGDKRVKTRYVHGMTYFPFSPSDTYATAASGTLSVRREDNPDFLAVEMKVSFDLGKARVPGHLLPIMDCVGRGRARRADRDELTPFFGAPVDFQHKHSAIKPGKARVDDAPFHLYCDWRRAKQ